MNKYILIVFILNLIFGQIQIEHSSNIHFGTIHRISDISFIKVPFRLANYSNRIGYGDFELNSNFALEFSIKDPIEDSFFTPEVREMYLSWYAPFGEISIGNMIHSWGTLSNNSPTDNLSPTNYYYIFSKGTERKVSQLSLTGDVYLGNHTFGFVFNPKHYGTKIPLNDSELPIQLPLPKNPIINEINNSEYGLRYKFSGSLFDFELSYFDGYDKTMSLFGANVWNSSIYNSGKEEAYIDTVLGYRKTELLGLGFATFIDELSLKTELGYFKTNDQIDDLEDLIRPFPGTYKYKGIDEEGEFIQTDVCNDFNEYYSWLFLYEEYPDDPFGFLPDSTVIAESECTPLIEDIYVLGTKADYLQYVVEFEYPIIFDIQVSAQFIFHDLLNITTGLDGEIPENKIINAQFIANFLPEDNFIPGIGAPLTIFTLDENVLRFEDVEGYDDNNDGIIDEEGEGVTSTVNLVKSRSVYLNLKKFFLDQTLEANFRTFFDVLQEGRFVEIEAIYDITDSWKVSSAINFINGNKSAGINYPFNPMEDFSHFRVEFIYSF